MLFQSFIIVCASKQSLGSCLVSLAFAKNIIKLGLIFLEKTSNSDDSRTWLMVNCHDVIDILKGIALFVCVLDSIVEFACSYLFTKLPA